MKGTKVDHILLPLLKLWKRTSGDDWLKHWLKSLSKIFKIMLKQWSFASGQSNKPDLDHACGHYSDPPDGPNHIQNDPILCGQLHMDALESDHSIGHFNDPPMK